MLGKVDLKGEPLNLDFTFESGQVFQWRKEDGWWLGTVSGGPVLLKAEDGALAYRSNQGMEEQLRRFLSLDISQDEVIASRRLDDFSNSLLQDFRGLRILRQDPWACLVTYVVSASLSILAIDKVLGRISLGCQELRVDGYSLQAFPGPEELSAMRRPARGYLGRKWGYLKEAAERVLDGGLDFERLAHDGYEEAWNALVTAKEGHLPGIGPKVADCMLLFSLEKREAFPMDRWILRGLAGQYPWLLPEGVCRRIEGGAEAVSHSEYATISRNVRSYFGDAGGLVQECLFLHMRKAAAKRPSA
ncbi:MAG TPA: DNA glycosylase [Conexivisphaerales archaeon]|nr:DNA glycosylase [Conexivisphaerales archaeon]